MGKKLPKIVAGINRVEIILLLVLAAVNLVAPFYTFYGVGNVHLLHYLAHHTIRRLVAFTVLIVSWKLYKRVGTAWAIAMIALSAGVFEYVLVYHDRLSNPWFLLELASYFILLLSRNYYCRKPDRYSLRRGAAAFIVYAAFVFFNAVFALLRNRGLDSFGTCVGQTVDVMFDADNLFSGAPLYHRFIFWFSWLCLVVGLFFFLTPYISARARTREEAARARELVRRYGENYSSYLALEKDKSYLFGRAVEGVIAYGIVQDTLVVLGEPICAPEDLLAFLSEIREYCERNAYRLLFLNVTGTNLKQYEKLGMGSVKCGEEPQFYLPDYSLAGGAAAKTRLNVNHATSAGLKVREYRPAEGRDPSLEREITEISREWFSLKKCSELVFTMGGIGFDDPMDRRYFYAVNPEGIVEGFIVFVPFKGMNGYVADVTRHRKGATRGVMEKIFYEAVMTFREEGFQWASLALAPLARMEDESSLAARMLNVVYEKMNGVYGFKALYQAKLKYNPTRWEPCYYVYLPPILTPSVAYAIVRIQSSQGLLSYAGAFFQSWRKRKTEKKPGQEPSPADKV